MEKLASQAAEVVLRELLKDENKDKLEKHVLDPSVKYIGERLWPYIIILTLFLAIILMMTAYIVYTTRKLYFKE
jgi:hypothetical protein